MPQITVSICSSHHLKQTHCSIYREAGGLLPLPHYEKYTPLSAMRTAALLWIWFICQGWWRRTSFGTISKARIKICPGELGRWNTTTHTIHTPMGNSTRGSGACRSNEDCKGGGCAHEKAYESFSMSVVGYKALNRGFRKALEKLV